MSSLGADILHKHGEFEFATPRRLSSATSPQKESIVSDEAMLKLMDSVRKQIKLFETTTHGCARFFFFFSFVSLNAPATGTRA